MIVERKFPSGAWEISDIIGDNYLHQVYFFYTKREAIAEFRAYVCEELGCKRYPSS